MRGAFDLSSGMSILTTLLSLILMSLVVVGIRLVFMQVFQRRRERENRQINERLKVLIAAYKTLGGSFTGELAVDPAHMRELAEEVSATTASERRRRIRDAVEAALSDIMLLGTEEQVRLAAQAANDMVEGKNIETAALVVSLRDFIRQALDLTPIPHSVVVPDQGPMRVVSGGGNGKRSGGAGGGGGGGKGGGSGGGGGGGIALLGDSHTQDTP